MNVGPIREKIVELASIGLSDKAIAGEMGLHRRTVDWHWSKLRRLFDVESTRAVIAAYWQTVELHNRRIKRSAAKFPR